MNARSHTTAPAAPATATLEPRVAGGGPISRAADRATRMESARAAFERDRASMPPYQRAFDDLRNPISRLRDLAIVQSQLLDANLPNADTTEISEDGNAALCFIGQEILRATVVLDELHTDLHNAASQGEVLL